MASPATTEKCLLTEKDLEMERGLKAMEVHSRLVLLARVELRVESALCFYVLEVDEPGSTSTTAMPARLTTRASVSASRIARPERFSIWLVASKNCQR